MKRIFRSIIDIKKNKIPTVEPTDLVKNYRAFLASNINQEEPSYVKLYTWIEAHFREYKEMPGFEYLYTKASEDGDEHVLANLKEVIEQQPFIGSDYRAILKEKFEDQCQTGFQKLLTTSWDIAKVGKKVGKKEIKGIAAASEYFQAESRKYRMKALGVKTEGSIRTKEEGKEVLEAYEKVKSNPMGSVGMCTNLMRVDATCRGLKLTEVMLVAAFVAQGKSTTAANLAYHGLMQGFNGLFIPLEMNYNEMRTVFNILHASSPEWLSHPKYKSLIGKISYNKVMDGELTEFEEEFYKAVISDFSTNPSYGELFIHQPTEPLTPSSLELMMYDYQAALADKGKELDFVVVDYVGLMQPDKGEGYRDYVADLNQLLRRLKHIASTFNNGKGMRIISPFQTNREGWKDAKKNDGIYSLTALSHANEAERSCDLVISLYMSDVMKKNGVIKICCLKNRRRAEFEPFEASIDLETKAIFDLVQSRSEDPDSLISEIFVDEK